ATIHIPQQTFTSDAQKLFCEDLSFNPWHGLTAHKPLGGINRARRDEMKTISDLRLKQRGITRIEPTGNESF
ncbi:MAG: catalase, partial [Nitrospirales bacterium]